MNIAVAYCRVSTKKQEEALKDHQEQWEEIFVDEGYEFANTGIFYRKDGYKEFKKGLYIDEGISAKEYKKHRKAFQQMIEDAMLGKFKQIFVEDTTRFARNVEDGMKIIKDLREHNVNVYFRKEKLNSIEVKNDMVLGVLFSVAENEIITDSRRLKWKMVRLHKAGQWTAPAPYGYSVKNGILTKRDDEVPRVDLIFYLYTQRLLGMRNIANYLNHSGSRTRKNQLWKSSEIRYILNNQIYIGKMINHKTESVDITRGTTRKIPESEHIVVYNEELRIIDDETWKKKDLILGQRNEKLKNREGYSSKHLLSTLLYCEQCGSTYMRVKKKGAKNDTGKKVERGYEWTCLGHNHYGEIKCKGRYGLQEDELIDFIKKELKLEQKRDNKYLLDKYLEKKREELSKINIEELKLEKGNMQRQIIDLRTEKGKNIISQETYEEQLEIINKRIDEIRITESHYNNIKIDIERAETRYKSRCDLLNNLNFNKLDNAELRQIFNKIKVVGEYENGYKKIYLHFSYNVLDETQTELLREDIGDESSIMEYYKPYKTEKIRKSTKTRYFNDK